MRRPALVRAAFAFVYAALCSACAPNFEYRAPPNQTQFEAFIDSLRLRNQLPALAVTVVTHDSTLARAAVGRRHLDHDDRVTLADFWQIGSLTKAFTASVIGVLVDRGKLSWTTTLGDAFPDLRPTMHPQYRDVTLTQLLSHAAGVPGYEESGDFDRLPKFAGMPREQRRAFVAFLVKTAPLFAPGSRHQYSNAGFTVAAAVAEQVANKPWESLIIDDLLTPMSVPVKFGWPAASDSAQPWGHLKGMFLIHPHDPHGDYQIPLLIAPAGAVSLTIDGYGAFMQAHLGGMSGHDGVLRAATVRMLHTAAPPVPASDTSVGWGFGWGVRKTKWGLTHGHAGSAGTFYSIVALLSDQDLGFAVFTNVGGDRGAKGAQAVLDSLRARYARKD